MEARNLEASKQPYLVALCTIMLTLATLAVLLRCWSVYVSPTHKLGLDDFFAILTLVSDLIFALRLSPTENDGRLTSRERAIVGNNSDINNYNDSTLRRETSG